MAESIERYFRTLRIGRSSRPSGRMWCPAADVYRTREGWIVKVDLAGVSPDDLKITVESATLSISGCRKDTFYGEGVAYQQLEITYSRFEKILQFPCSIEGASVRRDYRDGLLILYLRAGDDCD
jgi:HSP20 family protein